MQHTPLQITKTLLKPWSPCADGYKWFVAKFPQGGEFTAVQKALREDERFGDARWLTEKVWFNLLLDMPSVTQDVTADHKAEALEIIADTNALTLEVPTAEELGTTIPTITSDDGKSNTQIGASGNSTRIGASGNSTRINATGENAVIACAGKDCRARASTNGVMALPWFDEATQRTRIAVGYVGEDLKADTWYEVKAGRFVEVA